MKKSLFFRLLASSLALLLLLCPVLSACAPAQGGGDTSGTETEEQTVPEAPAFLLTDSWYIVRPELENDCEVAALQLLNRAIRAVYGAYPHVTTDFKRPDQELKRNKYEILIGRTNRPESEELTDSLSAEDACYRIVSENIIVITGGSSAAILSAAEYFARDVLGYEEDADKNPIRAGENCLLRVGTTATNPVKLPDVILNGTNLRDYVLVADKFTAGIVAFNNTIAALCGSKLREVLRTDYTGGPALFAGCADTASGHLAAAYDPYTFCLSVSGSKIAIDFTAASAASDVFATFWSMFMPEQATGKTKVTIPDGESLRVAVPGEVNGLMLNKRSDEKLAEGIVYSELLFDDTDGKPVRVYAVDVAAGAGTFYAGTPNDSSVQVEKKVQTVMKEIEAAAANGKKVVAGVNSGFFDMGGTGFSRGLVVKDGTLYAANTERPFFAQMKDGSVKILYSTEYAQNKDRIQNAVAGNVILLRGGKVTQISKGTDMAVTRHPRTAVGIRADGSVVILCVDGRQAKISNGASYGDLIDIFRYFGCTEAINLDGGGSTTFIRKTSAGKYVTENSPSDGALRSVQDSLFVLLPQ